MKSSILRFLICLFVLSFFGGIQSIKAQNGPACDTYTNKNSTAGLGSSYGQTIVYGVYAVCSTVYAATNNGLGISTDGGVSFTNKTTADGLGSNTINGVYVDGSTVYAATINGLSISTNGGASFTNKTIANGLGRNVLFGVYAIGNTVYVATDGGGLSISTDGGASFTNKTTADGLGNNTVWGVYAIGSTVYAATDNGGLSISTNGGASFTNKTTADGLGSNYVWGVYAVGSTVYAATQGGLSISTDGGATFTNKTTANGLGSKVSFGVFAIGSTVYVASNVGMNISTNGGASFTNYTSTNGLGDNYLYGVYASGNKVYAATDYGLSYCSAPYTSPTSGGTIATAQSGNNPFTPAAFTSSAAASGGTGTLEYKWQSSTTNNSTGFADIASSNAATYTAGALSVTTWFKRLARVSCSADWTGAASSNVIEVTVTTNGPSCDTYTNKTTANGLGNEFVSGVYAIGSTVYAATNGGLSISTDGGSTFINKTGTDGLGTFFGYTLINGVYADGSTVYAATNGGLSISTDGGASFTNYTTTNGLGDNQVKGVYAVGGKVYAATKSGLSISTDGGSTFANKTSLNGLGTNFVNGVYAVGNTVYAATGGGLSISTDGGATFTNKTTTDGLGNSYVRGVYAVGSTVYAATDGGLSISTDGGSSFINKTGTDGLGTSFGQTSIWGVYAVGSTVYAATMGGLSISTNSGASFANYTTCNGLGNNTVKGVFTSGSNIYAATQGGLSICSSGVVRSANTWLGTTSNLWNVGSNWSLGTIPVTTDKVVINTITPRAPQLNVDFTVGNSLTISGTGTLTVNAGKTLSVTTCGTVDFGGKSVTFKSDATGTAQLGQMLGTLSNASNVTMERYIPARRAFRIIATPLTTTTTIKQNWMENATLGTTAGYPFAAGSGVNPTAGYGTHITGAGGNTNGFDATVNNNPSMFTYNNGWITSTNTNATLAAGDAYRLFFRGDRGTDLNNNNATPSATVLRTTGTPFVGTKNYTLSSTAGAWNLVGNPFQATINLYLGSANNIMPYFYAWDPKMGTKGAYVAYDFLTGYNSLPGSQINYFLQPGQAIFIQTYGAGAANVSIAESQKALASDQTDVFQPNVVYPMLNVSLNYTDSLARNATAMDGLKVAFNSSFNNAVDFNDIQKLSNADENMSILRDDNYLCIEKLNMYNAATEIPLSISNYLRQQYTLRISWDNPADNSFIAQLKDGYTNTLTPINFSGNTDYSYTIDNAIAASKASDRFKIVFIPNAALPVSGIELGGTATDKQVKLSFKALNEHEMSNYAIERSSDGASFTPIGTQQPLNAAQASASYSFVDNQPIVGNNYYRIKGSSINGQIQYSNVVVVKYGVHMASVTVVPNPIQGRTVNLKLSQLAKGNYHISVTDAIGRSILKKEMLLDGSSSVQLNLPTSVKAGNYFVKVDGQGNAFIQSFIIQ